MQARTAGKRTSTAALIALGLLAGGGAVALRALVHRAAALARLTEVTGEELDLATWAAVAGFDAALLPGLLAGILAGAMARAGRCSLGLATVGVVLGASALAAAAAGWLDEAGGAASWHLGLALDNAALLVGLALVATVSLALTARRRTRLPATPWLVLVALFPPAATRLAFAADAPSFVRHESMLDLLARRDLWRVLESRPDHQPAMRVITPAVSSHSDSADKPSLWMAPPCAVELSLPKDLPAGVLRLAVGIDKRARNRMPKGLGDLTVDFQVELNGELVFNKRIYNERPKAGQFKSDDWTWRHAGDGAGGIQVQGGDRVVLRTSLPEGHPAAALEAEQLLVGFGGLVVEAHIETERIRARPEAPNLILVVQDTLRLDHCSTYGYERDTTPRLDQLAARGLRFDAAYSTSSWTWPSTASILTGLSADAHGVTSNESCTLNLTLDTVAEVLQRRGFTTAAWSCNPLVVPERYFDQGFERFDYHPAEFRKGDEVMPDVLRWLDVHAGTRFFLYLHLADPHTPHRPDPEDLAHFDAQRPADFPEQGLDAFGGVVTREGIAAATPPRRAWMRDLYDASVRSGDRRLGELIDRLDELGLTDKTLIVFTADHGEELLDRGTIGHGHGLHAELVRVPLVIAGPGVPAGMSMGQPVSNRHIGPTLATFSGGELPGLGSADWLLEPSSGQAMFATTKGKVDKRGYQELYGLRRGDLVLHWWKGADDSFLRLYDVAADPQERVDLAAERPDDVASLHAELERRLTEQREWAPRHRVGVGAASREMLWDIGYLGDDEDGEEDDERPR